MVDILMAPLPEFRFSFSRLLREPKVVAAAADTRPVLLDRRDGPDLVLLNREADERNRSGMAYAAQVMDAMLADSSEPIETKMERAFPWAKFLTEKGKTDFTEELVSTTRACAHLGSFVSLAQTVAAWKSTAEAYEAGWDNVEYDWLDEPVAVARP